jgi:hypothetical protein
VFRNVDTTFDDESGSFVLAVTDKLAPHLRAVGEVQVDPLAMTVGVDISMDGRAMRIVGGCSWSTC